MQVDSIAGHGVLPSFSLDCIYTACDVITGICWWNLIYSYGMLDIELKYICENRAHALR